MAETERTWTALQALLADNTAEAISPMDLRDAIISCLGGYASLYVNDSVTTQAIVAAPAKVTCWTGVGAQRGAAADPATDRIVVGVSGDYMLTLTSSLKANIGTDLVLYLYKNGLAVTGAKSRVRADTTELMCSLALAVTLAAGDIIEMYASCAPNANVTFVDAHLSLKRIG